MAVLLYENYFGRGIKYLSTLLSLTIAFHRYSALKGYKWVKKENVIKILIGFFTISCFNINYKEGFNQFNSSNIDNLN